jgi:hypothetical protein
MKRSLTAARNREIVLYNDPDWGLEAAEVTDQMPPIA